MLALALADRALAQGPVAQDCDYGVVRTKDPASFGPEWSAAHPARAYEGMKGRMAADEWLVLADSIVDAHAADPRIPAVPKAAFGYHLQALVDELSREEAAGDPQRIRRLAAIVQADRFRITSPTDTDDDEAYVLFVRGPEQIRLDTVDADARRALCWRALSIGRMLTAHGTLARQAALDALRDAARKWDNYGDRGYSQFPWELAINGARFDPAAIEPPRSQLIVLHPALSLELVAPELDRLDDLERVNSVTVEPIGFVWYSRSRSSYVGISTLLSLPEERRIGVGVLGHIGRYGKIGYVFARSPAEEGGRARRVVVSADLYQFLAGLPQRIREAKENALRQVRARQLETIAAAPR